jgi:CheY-like chemotaxis protein
LPVSPPLPRKSILVVEDDDDLRRIFRDSLKFSGFDVREAADGHDALQMIENAPPDVVVLDIRLPTLDGLSVREELAANPRTKDIPVVVVTGAPVDLRRLRGTKLLRKPVPPDDLVATVRASLHR